MITKRSSLKLKLQEKAYRDAFVASQPMKVIDPGHRYQLLTIDGEAKQFLQFVKREGPGYPGNVGTSPGTNLQSVLRACIDRVQYLQRQIYCQENEDVEALLKQAIYMLERRAADRHGMAYPSTRTVAWTAPMCRVCGHTVCEHEKEGGK